MIKMVFLIKRIDGMTLEAFIDYHRHTHAPLFASIPEASRYVRSYAISHPVAAPGYRAPDYDGLTEIWFESWADHDAFFACRNFLEKVKPDERRFIDPASASVMATDERLIIR